MHRVLAPVAQELGGSPLMRGEILIRTGMPALAVKEYREILSVMPEHVVAENDWPGLC